MIHGSDTPTTDAGLPASDTVPRIAAFMQRASIEATRPTPAEAEMLRETLPSGAKIFLSAVPNRPHDEVVASARAIRAAGLTPVPHIAARSFPDSSGAGELLARLHGEADVRAVLVIGGDLASPAGAVLGAQQLIESGVLGRSGIERVGIAGYPDGHPRMSDEELESTLVTKVAAAQSAGLEVHIVTQFCFDPKPILRWLEWLRRRGIHLPVEVGLAGPTSLMAWMNYARRCGVRASAEALARRSGLVKHVFNAVAPDPIIRALVEALPADELRELSPHLYSFGGIGSTARWVAGAMRGALTLDREDGFLVGPKGG
ncbi:MAG: methylenetetrahydrofolate reductase [Hyphomicrobiales bacterium]|nr:methylenetetrahydrofolate reductase [Hyphomicrobiales bacterium]